MAVTEDLDAWWVQITDYNESNAAKATFQSTMRNIDEQLNELQRAYAAGEYDKLPLSVKNKFVWAWQQLNTARNAVKADTEFMAAINWTP